MIASRCFLYSSDHSLINISQDVGGIILIKIILMRTNKNKSNYKINILARDVDQIFLPQVDTEAGEEDEAAR